MKYLLFICLIVALVTLSATYKYRKPARSCKFLMRRIPRLERVYYNLCHNAEGYINSLRCQRYANKILIKILLLQHLGCINFDHKHDQDCIASSEEHGDTSEDHEDTSEEYDDTSEEHDDTSEEYEDTSEEMDDSSEEDEDTSEDHEDTSEEYDDTSEEHDDTSEEYEDTSEEMGDSSEEDEDSSEEDSSEEDIVDPVVDPILEQICIASGGICDVDGTLSPLVECMVQLGIECDAAATINCVLCS